VPAAGGGDELDTRPAPLESGVAAASLLWPADSACEGAAWLGFGLIDDAFESRAVDLGFESDAVEEGGLRRGSRGSVATGDDSSGEVLALPLSAADTAVGPAGVDDGTTDAATGGSVGDAEALG
jgi:hypothetical protein